METNKISNTQLEIIKEVITPVKIERRVYERDFIEKQIIAITAQRDETIALKEAELAECQAILKSMDELGIASKKDAEIVPIKEIGEIPPIISEKT